MKKQDSTKRRKPGAEQQETSEWKGLGNEIGERNVVVNAIVIVQEPLDRVEAEKAIVGMA